ncbi:esterase E4 [Anabrus simplex]|uniref:esterase E4 n=1 Tax=Anabrus simplex TaxID=316456 RepID=UPI0035A32730
MWCWRSGGIRWWMAEGAVDQKFSTMESPASLDSSVHEMESQNESSPSPHATDSEGKINRDAISCRLVSMKILVGIVVYFLALLGAAAALLGNPRYMGPRAYDTPLNDTSPKVNPGISDRLEQLPVIQTGKGAIQGSYMLSRLGKLIYAFRGIRYAKPPVGNLRFQPPVEADPWDDIYDATDDRYACPQEEDYVVPTNEDCLFLNVYTTKLPTLRQNPRRAVMIWIHAGGWYGGTATSSMHGPQYLMDEDIVLVTLNYRLGALGFLSTGDGVIPGNNGLKDQVAAMKWVQKNILQFGGDPDRVTLAGYSAGAASVWLHMASPMSRGLFHQAIAMSSSINAQYDISERSIFGLAQRQANVLGCPNATSQEIKDCMMLKPAQEISSSIFQLTDWGIDPILIFLPVIEKKTGDGMDHFLTENVANIYLSGDFTQVPWITGHTRDEFSWKASTVLDNDTLRTDMDDNFDQVAPLAFMYPNQKNSDNISEALREFYLQDQPLSANSLDGLGNMYSDSIICFGVDRAAKVVANISSKPVWFYEFDYQGRYSFVYKPNSTVPYGVMHQDDSMYLFYMSLLFPFFNDSFPEAQTVSRMTRMWSDFVISGNPTVNSTEIHWEPMKTDSLNYLHIGSDLTMKKDLFHDRMALWDELFPLPEANEDNGGSSSCDEWTEFQMTIEAE